MRAFKIKNKFLVELKEGEKYAFFTKEGYILRWSSYQEWIHFGRVDLESELILNYTGEIKIPMLLKSVFTLWCRFEWNLKPAENKEVTLEDIMYAPVGATFWINGTDAPEGKTCDRLEIIKKKGRYAIVRLWKITNPDSLALELYETSGKLYKVFFDTGKVEFMKNLDKDD